MPILRVSPRAYREVRLSGFLQYGHLDILCQYADVAFEEVDTRLVTTHGLGTPKQLARSCARYERSGSIFLPWHKCPRESKSCVPIGSPWLYLLENMKDAAADPSEELFDNHTRFFVIPHSSTSQRYTRDWETIADQVGNWIGSVESENGALLLHWADFLNNEFVHLLRKFELPLYCVGYGGHSNSLSSFNQSGGRNRFLINTFQLWSRAKSLHVLEPTTLTYYASTLGVQIFLADRSVFDSIYPYLYPSTLGSPKKELDNREAINFLWHQHEQLSKQSSQGRIALASKILGKEYMHSRASLGEILSARPKLLDGVKYAFNYFK